MSDPEKSEKKKHPRVLHNNIQGIKKPALKRLLFRAGVKRVSSRVYEESRGILKAFLERILKDTCIFTEYNRRKTVQTEDLEAALDMHKISLGAGVSQSNPKKSQSLMGCAPHPGKAKAEGKQDNAKKHRFHPGVVSLRSIRYHQKNSDCLAIPKLNFERLVRELAQEYQGERRFSTPVFSLLQLVAEDHLVKLYKNANLCAIHAERTTLKAADLQLAKHIAN